MFIPSSYIYHLSPGFPFGNRKFGSQICEYVSVL